jgi:hypothetical protein
VTHRQGWEPILRKTIFDNDTDTHHFFYFRLSADNAKKSIGIAMNDDFAMKIKKNTKFPKMHDTLLNLITGKNFVHR